MKIAIMTNPIVVGEYWELFPNTSFPSSGPNDDFLIENNAKKCSFLKDYDRLSETLVFCDPYEEGEWVYLVRAQALTQEQIDAEKELAWVNIRTTRNDLLADSDWTQMPDVSMPNKSEWATYRQSLRDITSLGDPRLGVTWPAKPA